MRERVYKHIIWPACLLTIVLIIGTVGYWFIGEKQYPIFDCFYMTIITISTIGYGEIIDLSNNIHGRIFTILIAVSGIGILTYLVTHVTAYLVEGEIGEQFKRRIMEKRLSKLKSHYIVCGAGSVGINIIHELYNANNSCVIIDTDKERSEELQKLLKDPILVEGDATEEECLLRAGIHDAIGLFAATEDDNQNLVISLVAKQLNPGIKIIANCRQTRHANNIKQAGADIVVSPPSMGGFRMAAEMTRPTVISLIDTMLAHKRISEIPVPENMVGKPIATLKLNQFSNTLLIAVHSDGQWIYNPRESYITKKGDILIMVTPPEERRLIQKSIGQV